MTPADFWSATPWEAACVIRAAAWRDRRELRSRKALAWFTAAFAAGAFTGKLRPLSEHIGPESKDSPQSTAVSPNSEALLWEMFAKAHNARVAARLAAGLES